MKVSPAQWFLLAIGICLLALVIWCLISAIWPEGSPCGEGYGHCNVKNTIQDTVNNYKVSHNGELPPHEGSYNVNVVGYCYIIDICSLVGDSDEGLMRAIPEGCLGEKGDSGTNFYSGNCNRSTDENGHYVWLVDNKGNIYSVCDVNDDGMISEDGAENADGLHDNIWP